jgi:hypothetical protein
MKPGVARLVRALLIGVAALVVLAAGAGVYAWVQLTRVVVTVRNLGPDPVTNVQVSLGSGRATAAVIPPGQDWRPPLAPRGTLILDLDFELGRQRCHHRNDYLEAAGGYRIGIEIRGCQEVRSNYTIWPGSPFDAPKLEE